MNNNILDTCLGELSDEINKLYGYVKIAGDNFGEPAINSGPCGPFANAFFRLWNLKFPEKVLLKTQKFLSTRRGGLW